MTLSFKEDDDSITFVLDQLNTRRHNMTEWEQGFIKSVKQQFEEDRPLSDKQLKFISDLWEKY